MIWLIILAVDQPWQESFSLQGSTLPWWMYPLAFITLLSGLMTLGGLFDKQHTYLRRSALTFVASLLLIAAFL